MAHLLETRSAATASVRFRALQQYFAWLVDDEHIETDPMAKMKVPLVPEQPVPILSEDDLRALLATCRSRTFEDRRDEAIIRLLADTGIRRGELLGMECGDVDLDVGVVTVLGKGRRRRQVPLGARTARAMDRYNNLRAQRVSGGAAERFWLTGRGCPLQESGLATMLNRRGVRAGLGRRACSSHAPRLRPHLVVGRRQRGRPHAPRGLADQGDAGPLWSVRGRSTCS